MGQLSWSKWSKHKVLKESAEVFAHLPETRWMTEKSFWKLLNKYKEIILKPSSKSGGSGVVQVSSEDGVRFEVHSGRYKKQVSGKNALIAYVQKLSSPHYIIQRRIPLAQVHGRPFDLRIMVQRKKNADWNVTGRLAKIAGKGYIITNTIRSNGYVLPVEQAIQRSNLKQQRRIKGVLSEIDRVALMAADQLRRFYPGIRTIGLDMGLDVRGKAWIIEANFTPMTSLFLKLKDKSMYQKILTYK
ncbi:YheC/YheD family protein [Cohnella zeiphila]|uniref:YheC/YheD family protein n=1 Tax=Cohnella zeiphila TaxID=2761120 RepID=A0A7X0VY94_9BACL|nr:YheC/YheD family protein [Cohnella zeiphila]MBB6732713.1 YheC/YheD family protein [Cohnella zeiphila]